ncbi:hypothetical protein BM1_03393 [Bipolaris maydis]|nr:hypothetical protein BM1_03393 [Bipolaris maydis]
MSTNKRGNIFGQGKPERPYEERDEPADVPQRATAAQLAARKKMTFANTRAKGLSQSANFGAPQQNGFNFGASAPAPANGGTNAFGGFGGNNAFGGASATSSFPPAQPAAPSSTFSSSSFPAFGGSNSGTGTGFNPQPPSSAGFNFTAGGSNPFATASSAPATNGSTPAPAPAFGGSIFGNSQTQSNPFGGLAQSSTSSAAPSTSIFGTSSAAPSGGLFGTSSAAPSGGLFGTTSGAANAPATTAPASTPFTFGATSSSAQNTASTPATSGIFSSFGNSTQTAPPAQNSIFSSFGTNAQKEEAPKEPAASQNSIFGGFGSNAQKTDSATETPKQNNIFGSLNTGAQSTSSATASGSGLFNFGASAQKTDGAAPSAPSTGLFGASTSATPSAKPSAPADNPFANLPTAAGASTPFKGFGATSQTPQAQEKTPAPSANLFGNLNKPEESSTTAAPETPKSNPFASLAKPATPPAAAPAATSSGFSLFGTDKDKDSSSATLKAPEASKSSLFQPFSTPQPAKTADAEKPQGGLFSAAQPKTSSGLFSQTFQPEANKSSNLFSKPQSSFSSFTPSATSSTEAPKAPAAASPSSEKSNPFASLSTPSTDRPNLFSAPKEPAQVSPAPAMPNLTGSSTVSNESQQTPEIPKVPKVHVPKEWSVPGVVRAQSGDSLLKQITDLTAQLQVLNGKYRQQISTLPPTADWSSVSLWHYQHSTDIKKKIDNAKKQRAASRGVTGTESSLSTKRKADEDNVEARDPSPIKRSRPAETPASPTPQPSASTPKLNPPATATSNMFAKAIGNKPSTPSAPSTSSTNLFAPKTAENSSEEPAKANAPATGFGFSPSLPATNGASSSSTSSGFKPTFGSTPSSASGSTGFKPNFGSAPGGGGFMAQFTKTAKTYDELAAERKKKAMEEDYDSDEETEEQWSARYDKAEEERRAEEKKKAAATPTFTFGASAKPDAQPSGSTPKSNPFSGLLKPTSGASTPGGFTPKDVSPAPSTGGQSVFNAPAASPAPSSNIFGHLSSGPSSNNQDESDEDDGEQQEIAGSVEPATPRGNFGESEAESEETQEQKKPNTSSKGSLLSRITRDNDSESEKENNGISSTAATNGTTTPTNKPFQFFDFNAASKTAPPKSDTFAGDQTFKFGSPIKFGQAPATEKKDAPKFQFQPATPSPGEGSTTPAKPPPSSIFNFASTGGSSLFAPSGGNSIGSSVFSSRAGTPLSEAGETSAASAAEDEEGEKHEQIDLSQLTEEELNTYDIVFHTDVVLAKHQVDKDGEKAWVNLAKGPLWILKDKETAKCSVRVRIPSGATPLNYQILPSLPATVTGSSKKMVMATKPAKEGGLQSVIFAVKSPEIAVEMAAKYTESVPSP